MRPIVGFLLHDVARLMRKRFEQCSRNLDLTRSQWQVLDKLAINEGIHQQGLADLLKIESVTLLRLLEKMEHRGLIERRRHQTDRRLSLIFLTQTARPLLQVMHDLGEQTRVEAMTGFSHAECEQMLQMLTRMHERLVHSCMFSIESDSEKHPRRKSQTFRDES